MAINDEVIWTVIGSGHCSFKTKLEGNQVMCRNPYSLTGMCNRSSCPLANSQYATIREDKGKLYLYMKTVERAHTPRFLWERVKLPKDYAEAIALLDEQLQYWPKFQVHKCKQRLTKMTQYLLRMRRLRKKAKSTMAQAPKKVIRREVTREQKALDAAAIEGNIEKELLERLKTGVYGDIYNFPQQEYESALDKAEKSAKKAKARKAKRDAEEEEEEEEEEEAEGEMETAASGAGDDEDDDSDEDDDEEGFGTREFVEDPGFDEDEDDDSDVEDLRADAEFQAVLAAARAAGGGGAGPSLPSSAAAGGGGGSSASSSGSSRIERASGTAEDSGESRKRGRDAGARSRAGAPASAEEPAEEGGRGRRGGGGADDDDVADARRRRKKRRKGKGPRVEIEYEEEGEAPERAKASASGGRGGGGGGW